MWEAYLSKGCHSRPAHMQGENGRGGLDLGKALRDIKKLRIQLAHKGLCITTGTNNSVYKC